MRYIKDIVHPQFKIGLYQWNNKYIIKIEMGLYEQTYKIDDYEIASMEEIDRIFDEAFMLSVSNKFEAMSEDFMGTLRRNEIIF